MDMQMGRRSSISTMSLQDDPNPRRPAGYERGVTALTVMELCQQEKVPEAVEALGVLVQADWTVSKYLFYAVVKKCAVKKDVVLGRRAHALVVKIGYESDRFLCNHILRMYASYASLQEAMDVFTVVVEPDVFMWSSIISAHVSRGQSPEAIQLYHKMRLSRLKPDGHVFVAALQACARGGDLKSGQQVHADVLASDVEPDLFVCNCLVDMYAKCDRLEDAHSVFDGLRYKDVVTWNAMIAGYSQQGMGQQALQLYDAMQHEGMHAPNYVTFVCLLQACATVGAPALELGRQLHGQINERRLRADVVLGCSLVNMYAKCGSLQDAQSVFDRLGQKDVVTWNAMIAGYSQQGMGQEALHLYSAMRQEGSTQPDSVTYVSLLQACASVGIQALEMGNQLHKLIEQGGLQVDVVVGCSLVNMYAKCGSLQDAQTVFDRLPEKNVVTWTALITGYCQKGMVQEALRVYSTMQQEGVAVPNSITFLSLLQACASVGVMALEKGKQLHAQIREQGLQADVIVANNLLNMYAKCGSLQDAQNVFDELHQKDIVTWNTLIAGYSQQGMSQGAFNLYSDMRKEGATPPNSVTFVCLLQACANEGPLALEKGKQLHADIGEHGLQVDIFVANSLITMYAKCGSLEDAQSMFDGLVAKDVVTWNAMIAGYSQHGMAQEAFRLYSAMQQEGITAPNSVTFVCLLQACANVSALHKGKQIHGEIKRQGFQADWFIAISLINMYAKCGSMVDAQQVFDALSGKDIVAWNSLIAGYTRQGDTTVVFALLDKMREDGIQPDSITFLSLLTVCSHSGLVSKGREYYEAMRKDHGITPTTVHYSCMVDLLGRAGHLHEALAVVRTMPLQPHSAVWRTLLGACRKWGNVEVGRHAFEEAVKLDERDVAAFVLMSNIYTSAQMWQEAREIQARRTGIGAWKEPGQSWWTDMDGLVHRFVVGDKKHLDSAGIYARLKQLVSYMKKVGYVPRLDSSPPDFSEM